MSSPVFLTHTDQESARLIPLRFGTPNCLSEPHTIHGESGCEVVKWGVFTTWNQQLFAYLSCDKSAPFNFALVRFITRSAPLDPNLLCAP